MFSKVGYVYTPMVFIAIFHVVWYFSDVFSCVAFKI